MQDYRDLKVWRKAHALTLAIYDATRAFPTEERYGLTSQLRRGSSSIASNIAEGCGRRTDADFGRFLHMAVGSACEVEYQLMLSRELHLLSALAHDELSERVVEVRRMLLALISRLRAA